MEYYSAIKNNGFMKFLAKWLDLEGIILSEVTQSQKNSHMYTHEHTHVHTHVHTHAHTHMYTHIYTHTHLTSCGV
jgi:hypothetical protein